MRLTPHDIRALERYDQETHRIQQDLCKDDVEPEEHEFIVEAVYNRYTI